MHKQYDLIPALSVQRSRFESVSGSISLGSVHTKLDCLQLSAAGDHLIFALPQLPDGGASCCVLELDELHTSAGAPFAYELLLDDELLTVRTMIPVNLRSKRIAGLVCPAGVYYGICERLEWLKHCDL